MKTKKVGMVEELKRRYKKGLAQAASKLEKDYIKGRPKAGVEPFDEIFEANIYLFRKWAYRVGKGWYGFDLNPIPYVWLKMLDEFLAWVESQCPDFEIHQIKTKFGCLHFYIETHGKNSRVDKVVHSEISKLETLLSHENLRY